jgi:hypothetical protein
LNCAHFSFAGVHFESWYDEQFLDRLGHVVAVYERETDFLWPVDLPGFTVFLQLSGKEPGKLSGKWKQQTSIPRLKKSGCRIVPLQEENWLIISYSGNLTKRDVGQVERGDNQEEAKYHSHGVTESHSAPCAIFVRSVVAFGRT